MPEQKSESPRSLRTAVKACFSPKTAKPFAYQSLQDDEVRFLNLQGGASTRKLQCSLITDRLAAAAGSYTAISYVWGQNPRRTSIECDGDALEISENLHNALCAIRRRDRPAHVWADAICINQQDNQEKARQLRLMGQVYGSATKVIIWLGNDEKMAPKAFEMVHRVAAIICAPQNVRPRSLQTRQSLKSLVNDVPVRLFPPNDSRDWEPLAWLYTQRWFERVWVIQEVSSNPDVDVLCGSHCIDWPSVALVATWIEANDEYFSRTKSVFGRFRGIYNASFMFEKGRFDSGKAWLRLLDEARTFSATDPRDSVFGLLGHPSIRWNEDVGTQGLRADYSKSVAEVFADVTVRLVQQSRSLDVLSQVDHGQSLDEPLQMASWIPRFDQQSWASAFILMSQLHLDAGAGTAPTYTDTSPGRLSLRGVSCGQITSVTEAAFLQTFDMTHEHPNDPIANFWLSHVDHEPRYPTGETQETAMAMTLSAGTNTSLSGLPDARFTADFAAYLLTRLRRAERHISSPKAQGKIATSLHRLQKASAGGQSYRCADAVGIVCPYRRLCVTSEGYFGLGPEAMRPGDSVCVFYGGGVPFVVRAKGKEWLLVGEVYMHGLMSGEAVRAARKGRRREEMFVLV